MSFREVFLTTARPYDQNSIQWITESGFRANLEMKKAELKVLKAGFEHVAQTQIDASDALRGELAYQADRLGRQIAKSSSDVVDAVHQSSAEIVNSIQQMSDYIGAGLLEVRWAVERHSEVSQEILRLLLNSLDNESRQYYEQGVKCYETSEYQFAKRTFNKALEANITNHFAYQYLGFIAVAEDDSSEAIRNFDLARKFAENTYHQALALSHLARSRHAMGEIDKAVELAKSATDAHPSVAKFWYEFATYSAKLRRRDPAIAALKEAIERDWMFFVVVIGDADFDPVRADVNALLDMLRERERRNASQVLDGLHQALDLAKKAGAAQELSRALQAIMEFEKQCQQGNVFLYREVVAQSKELLKNIYAVAQNAAEKGISDKKQEIAGDRKQMGDLSLFRGKLERLHDNVRMSDASKWLVVFGYLSIFLGGITGLSLIGNPNQEDGYYGWTTLIICLPLLLLWVYVHVRMYRSRMTIPRQQHAEKIETKQKQIESLKRATEHNESEIKAKLEPELRQIKVLLMTTNMVAKK